MTTRLLMLRRIERVYGLVEEMHSLALRQALGLLHESEAAIAEQLKSMQHTDCNARRALDEADRQQWRIAMTQQAAESIRKRQLEFTRLERKAATDAASDEYEASRRKSEQMKRMVEQGASAEALIADRQTQAATDDRFLSRLCWGRLRLEER